MIRIMAFVMGCLNIGMALASHDWHAAGGWFLATAFMFKEWMDVL